MKMFKPKEWPGGYKKLIMFSFERGRIVNIALSVNMLGEGGLMDCTCLNNDDQSILGSLKGRYVRC